MGACCQKQIPTAIPLVDAQEHSSDNCQIVNGDANSTKNKLKSNPTSSNIFKNNHCSSSSSLLNMLQNHKRNCTKSNGFTTNSNLNWKANGYSSIITSLENSLNELKINGYPNIPSALIIIITEFCHIQLSKPKNSSCFITETVTIHPYDGLIMSYQPDPNILQRVL